MIPDAALQAAIVAAAFQLVVNIKKAAIQQIPVGRLGEADDFASLAVWLLSKQSGFVTGQTIMVDGGAVKSTL